MSRRRPVRILLIVSVGMLCCCAGLPPADDPISQPRQERAVVFDIDGTLTPRVHTIYTARMDAAEVANVLADKGYLIVYLSARVRSFSAGIPSWLKENGFPDGSIRVARTVQDRKHPGAFKTGVLEQFIHRGWTFELAYGDSSTDFEAYATVGIPKERVFALLREGDKACQPGEWNACLAGWTEHLDFIRQSVAPAQSD
jgi:hypothetical protein